MREKNAYFIVFLYCLLPLAAIGQRVFFNGQTLKSRPLCHVIQYDEDDGVPSPHVTQLLQDSSGFLWFATWNGLCRFDGYEFQTFKPEAGDGCQIPTDRIRDIGLLPDEKILCRVDDDYYLFDLRTNKFLNTRLSELPDNNGAMELRDLSDENIRCFRQSQSLTNGRTISWEDAYNTRWSLSADGSLTSRTKEGLETHHRVDIPLKGMTFACADNQGNLWLIASNRICKLCTGMQHTERLDIHPPSEVKCLFSDSKAQCWVTTRDGAVRVYDKADGSLKGFLGSDGQLHPGYTLFSSPVYSMYEQADGTLWLGTKPGGLFQLKPSSVTHCQTPDTNIYNMVEDRYGRLWVATLGGGICYTAKGSEFKLPAHYPHDSAQRVRFLHIVKDSILLAATTDGFVVAALKADADDMVFHVHQREPERTTSLSSSATMDILETAGGDIFVSTESGGINKIESTDLLAEELHFHHINAASHQLPSDIALSMTPMNHGKIMVVSGHLVTLLDSAGHTRVLDSRFFRPALSAASAQHNDFRFSDAHPQHLGGGQWLFGLTDGAIITTTEQMWRQAFTPRLVLTSTSVHGGNSNWAVEHTDTLTLKPNERSITVHFAALDYSSPERIDYAFRMTPEGSGSNTPWNHIGHDRSVTLLDLGPGTYLLEIRSTNDEGEWADNIRALTIVVKPKFWESAWGRLLIIVIIALIIALITSTILYIRKIKRKQRETLKAYLALLDSTAADETAERSTEPPAEKPHAGNDLNAIPDNPIIQRVMAYIEKNMSNSNANIGDMAAEAAISRSGLQRKLKEAMGITPLDLLREARVKHACHLLCHTDKTVSEVAYACGFTDPKYFSRSFKQSTGLSPSDYKAAHGG